MTDEGMDMTSVSRTVGFFHKGSVFKLLISSFLMPSTFQAWRGVINHDERENYMHQHKQPSSRNRQMDLPAPKEAEAERAKARSSNSKGRVCLAVAGRHDRV